MSESYIDKLQLATKDFEIFMPKIKGFVIENDEDEKMAATLLAAAKIRMKRIEELRIFFVKPLNDHVSEINKGLKGLYNPLKEVSKELDIGLSSHHKKREAEKARIAKEEEEKRLKEEAEALKAAEAAKKVEETALPAQANTNMSSGVDELENSLIANVASSRVAVPETKTVVNTGIGKVSYKKVWTYELEDVTKIPREYLIVDEKRIGQEVRSGKLRELAGVNIFEKTTTQTRV